VRRKVTKSEIDAALWHTAQVNLEIIYCELTVDIVKLEFMFVFLVFLKVFWRKVFEGLKIKRALFIDTLVNVKVLALLLFHKDSAAIWANEGTDFEVFLVLVKSKPTDLAQKLTTAAGIVIEVYVRSTTTMADNIRGYRVFPTGLDGFKFLAVFGFIVTKQLFVVKFLQLLYDRQPVHGKLVILWTGSIVLWGLYRYIFHDKQK
jgi:hypothetical protein